MGRRDPRMANLLQLLVAAHTGVLDTALSTHIGCLRRSRNVHVWNHGPLISKPEYRPTGRQAGPRADYRCSH